MENFELHVSSDLNQLDLVIFLDTGINLYLIIS